jgi:signal peptidase I
MTPIHHSPPGSPDPAALPQSTVEPASNFSRSLREMIESIAIAFALAFLFKAFEAEAFVIPTGSMAPTLMGRHKDVICPECGYRYTASGSEEAERDGSERTDPNYQVVECTCPICRYPLSVDPRDPANQGRDAKPSYSGDRIWVSRAAYQWMEPKRWDVIVFRYPEEAETYYIKRLVGLPNETVKIFHGDIYTKGPDDADFVIQRKPPAKVRAMAQVVHDNDFVSSEVLKRDWPLRWKVWSAEETPGEWQISEDTRTYRVDGSAADDTWIRYEHILPSPDDWTHWMDGQQADQKPAPQLITDFYAFNTRVLRGEQTLAPPALGLHWVGDLILDCQIDVQSPTGSVLFDLVKGGRHFGCEVDVASGEATLSIDSQTDWRPKAMTPVRGVGKHRILFANVDRQLLLWVDDNVMTFDVPTTYDDLDNSRPQAGDRRGGDLAPLGIGSRKASVVVDHLRVLRDIYYIADRTHMFSVSDYPDYDDALSRMSSNELVDFFSNPARWDSPRGHHVFDSRRSDVTFPLAADQFFVLGDNSPASSDARLWRSQYYVERELLIGKALFVYWPHPVGLPIPFTGKSIGILPNLSEMGQIH